jgi:hypothetical protein
VRCADLHRLVEGNAVLVMQKPHQFRPGDGGVRVVELDRDLFGQATQIAMFVHEPAQDVGQRRGGEEILLLEAEFLARGRGVVGVEHPADRARDLLPRGGPHEIAPVETVEVEALHRMGGPEAQRIGPACVPAHHGRVIGGGHHGLPRFPATAVGRPAEPDAIARLGTLELPGMGFLQPGLGQFHLAAIDDALPEQPVFVADAVAMGGHTKR